MSTLQEIESLLGRPVEFEQVTFQGQQGYIPIYFNHGSSSFVSSVLSETEDEAASKFLEYLKTVTKGDTDGNNRDQGDPEDN